MVRQFLLGGLCICSCVWAEGEQKEISKISEAFGHLIGKNLETLHIDFDIESIAKGLKDALEGKQSPMTEAECIEAISMVQEEVFQKESQTNLAQAESFLEKNVKNEGVVELEKGKLQYKIEKKGEGEVVKDHFSPSIHYVGKFSDGSVFGQSKEDEVISLDETIPGFTKGIVGMKEGEKRTLYIHPDYGYGTQRFLPPNSLLTFEIEVVKANTPTESADETITIETTKEPKTGSDFEEHSLR